MCGDVRSLKQATGKQTVISVPFHVRGDGRSVFVVMIKWQNPPLLFRLCDTAKSLILALSMLNPGLTQDWQTQQNAGSGSASQGFGGLGRDRRWRDGVSSARRRGKRQPEVTGPEKNATYLEYLTCRGADHSHLDAGFATRQIGGSILKDDTRALLTRPDHDDFFPPLHYSSGHGLRLPLLSHRLRTTIRRPSIQHRSTDTFTLHHPLALPIRNSNTGSPQSLILRPAIHRFLHPPTNLSIHHMIPGHDGKRRGQNILNRPPPAGERGIPLHRPGQALLETDPLLPAQLPQLRAINCVAPVIEGPVDGMLDPGLQHRIVVFGAGRDAEDVEQLLGEVEVADLVPRVDVVGLAQVAAVDDGVDGVGRVAGVEVAARVLAVAVDEEGPPALEEVGEFGDDFCGLRSASSSHLDLDAG